MRKARTIVMAGCLGFLLAGIGGAGDAWAKPFRYSVAGVSLPTTIDTNEDGSPAINISGEGQSTLGPIRLEVVSEFVLDMDPPGSIVFCALPDGSPGIQLAQILGSSVIQARRGDLVTAEVVEGTGCFSLETCLDDANEIQPGCITSTHIRFEITGGTGAFAEATGYFEAEATTETKVVSPTGNFSAFVSEAKGEIFGVRGHHRP